MKPTAFRLHNPGQSGAVLVVSLLLLVILMLLAVATMNFTNVHSRIASNLQMRSELKSANQQAIEQVISSNFTTSPLPSTVFFDVNADSSDDYKVTVSHTCMSSVALPVDSLNVALPDDASCTMSAAVQNSGVADLATVSASLCANSLWDVVATGTDAPGATLATAASVVTHQGVAVRVAVGSGC
jgi:Tfp pilus assembly protein PilX